jgi:zinc transport system substrate-binding protein
VFRKLLIFSLFLALIIIIIGGVVVYRRERLTSNFDTPNGKLKIVTTLFPLYDFARAVGQDRADVILLTPANPESLQYSPRAEDMAKISHAQMVVYTNPIIEPWIADTILGFGNDQLSVINASQHLQYLHSLESSTQPNIPTDPHVWLDFANDKIVVQDLAEVMAQRDPDHSDYYQQNAQTYQQQLDQLDQAYQTSLANCAHKTIVFAGQYDFGYLVHRYGLQLLAAQGTLPAAEPSDDELINFMQSIKNTNPAVIFYEQLSSPRVMQTLRRATTARLLPLDSAHTVTTEQLDDGLSFLTIMRRNLTNLQSGLGCN